MSIGLITAAALIPANPVPRPAPIPAKKVTIIVKNNDDIINYNAASDSSYSGNTDNYSSDSSYADNVFNNANNDSSSYGSSASEEPGNSYTGSVNNAPYGSPFDNDKSDN